MKFIKIIDLLNMIAEGKEVPKKIKYNEIVYSYCDLDTSYNNEEYTRDLFLVYDIPNILNDTVEIIEEDNNKIEKLKYHNSIPDKEDIKDLKMFIREILQNENILLDKINEIIDKINKENNI